MPNEGRTTHEVEKQTSKVPSLTFMGFAVAAMAASAVLVLTGRKQLGNFVGQWAPTILIMGLYNKIAKEIAVPRSSSDAGYGTGAGYGSSAGMGTGLGSSMGPGMTS
jgi:limonene-1,2-epoxide hydrolase